MKSKVKKSKYVIPAYASIVSPYTLSSQEIEHLQSLFPILAHKEIKNTVDESLLAGVIIQVGTKRIDLSLSGGLKNLQHYIYESS